MAGVVSQCLKFFAFCGIIILFSACIQPLDDKPFLADGRVQTIIVNGNTNGNASINVTKPNPSEMLTIGVNAGGLGTWDAVNKTLTLNSGQSSTMNVTVAGGATASDYKWYVSSNGTANIGTAPTLSVTHNGTYFKKEADGKIMYYVTVQAKVNSITYSDSCKVVIE